MDLKVIGAGFGRTGTLSLKQALEHLGLGPCHHMSELRRRPETIVDWRDRADGRDVAFERLLEGFASAVDWPASAYWKPLAEACPQAQVILTVRDMDDWADSMAATIIPANSILSEDWVSSGVRQVVRRTVMGRVFAGDWSQRDGIIERHKAHIEEVKRTIPADRLLVFDVRDGWDPLCRFLEVPTPTAPFPMTNSTKDFIAARPHLSGSD